MGGYFSSEKPVVDAPGMDFGGTTAMHAKKSVELDISATPPHTKRVAQGEFGEESMAHINDFAWSEGNDIDFRQVLLEREAHVTPYCLDHVRRRIIFADADTDKLESSHPFVYQSQRQFADKLYAVPYSVAIQCINEKAQSDKTWMNKIVMLHSTGRCGSTLLCKLLGMGSTVVSLSEPDVYSYVRWLVSESPTIFAHQDLSDLLRVVTWMYCTRNVILPTSGNKTYEFHVWYNYAQSRLPNCYVCIKMRSQCIGIAEAMKTSMPQSKSIFLYRNPIDTIDSTCVAFFKGFVQKWVRSWHVDSYFIFTLSGWKKIFNYIAPLLNDPRFPPASYYPLGFIGLAAMAWLSVMDEALRLQKEHFFDSCIMYEDLCEYRTAVADRILADCGFNGKMALSQAEASGVFDNDAHGDAATVSARRKAKSKDPLYVLPADVAPLMALLSVHAELNAANNHIPHTATFV